MKYLKQLPYYGFLALFVYMPFHIFLSQSLSLATGGLSAWKVAKDIVLFLLVAVSLYLVWRRKLRSEEIKALFLLSLSYGVVHLLVWALNPHIFRETAFQGVVYNSRVLLFALYGAMAVHLSGKKITADFLIKLTLILSTIVCVFGLLQYVLPKDLLTHVGYSIERGVKPAFFIDDKPDLPRIMSTLRDPNSLGAFLLVPLCMLYGLFIRFKNEAVRRNKIIGLTLLHVLALFLTFSRGSWAGAVIALVVCMVTMRTGRFVVSKRLVLIAASVLVVLGGLAFVFRDQHFVENVIKHSDENTVAVQDSNDLHLDFASQAFKKSVQRPQGHGPGTAGIVSIRNPDGGQLTENYYLQLLYEVGIIGLAVFLCAVIYIMRKLRATGSLLGASLFAAMLAYAFMGMLMHLWSNEAVAAQWWLLAGAALGLGAAHVKDGQALGARRNLRRKATD